MVFSRKKRSFLKKLLGVSGSLLLHPFLRPPKLSAGASRARVIIVKNAALVGGGSMDDALAAGMLEKAMVSLTGAQDGAAAWGKYFSAGDRVGLKLNCIAGSKLSPKPVLVQAIIENLIVAGVAENDIILWDRYGRELARAGFPLNKTRSGPRCFGTDAVRVGYESSLLEHGTVASRFSRILTKLVDKVINVSVLKNHDVAGVSVAMKNHMGSIHNPSKYHGTGCSPYVADLCGAWPIKSKNTLNICDGTTAQCHNGPGYKARWAWPYGGIIVSEDMVAIDSVAAKIINTRRVGLELEPVEVKYLPVAAEMGLGVCDPDQIERIDLDV